jgi:hypothetical protein
MTYLMSLNDIESDLAIRLGTLFANNAGKCILLDGSESGETMISEIAFG